ncbi:MAG: thioredoxin [Candidatus Aminicenantales bacterium]
MAADILNVSDATFEEEVLKSPLPVLIDFWAVWCAPCHIIAPAVEEIAGSHKEKLKVAKMNVDENMNTPAKYGIRGIPTLLLFKGGELKETMVGVQPKAKIIEVVAKHL